jgi:Arc/MetJ family transcription regulator
MRAATASCPATTPSSARAQGDLDELLMAEGLVRLYGMYMESGWGGRKQSALKRLESDAKREGTGAWGTRPKREASARADEAPRE